MPPSSASNGPILAALRLFSLTLIALHLAAPLFQEAQAWGLWPTTYLPPIWRWGLALAAALLCVPWVATRVLVAVRRHAPRIFVPIPRNAQFILIALATIIPFTLFPIVHTRWGDAFILVNGIAFPDPELRITATWQAPLDVWLHARLWLLGNRVWGWADAWPVYRIVSPLAGAAYVYALLRLADSVGRNRTEKSLIVGLMATLGTMQLFFGYVENYVLAAVGVLVFLWLSLQVVAGRRAPWQPALALALSNGLHPSTVVLGPALLWVAWAWLKGPQSAQVDERPVDTRRMLSAVAQVALPMVLVAAGVIALMTLSGHGLEALTTTDRPGGGDARFFVPLWAVETRWEHYTMFSWAHLRDWLNMQVLTAPVTLGGLAIVGVALSMDRKRVSGRPTQAGLRQRRFLILATALYWLFTWVWNPDYGGQRDWDLFSLAAIPSTLLLARLLPLALRRPGALAQAGLMLTAVSAMHTIAWVYQNTLPWEWP